MKKISTIITTHAEGKLIIKSIDSCNAAVDKLNPSKTQVEKLIVMDRPNMETREIVHEHCSSNEFEILEVNFGDQGQVRNHLVSRSKGDYIAFLDGDDLWSENWLKASFDLAVSESSPAVIFPEFNWFFEGSNNILCQIDSSRPWYDHESLRVVNLWDALCFCPREVYLKIPFAKRDITGGYAYEDWNWNRRVLEAGISQKIATDTIIFKRRRAGSQGAHAEKRNVIAFPTASCYYDFYTK